MISRLLSKASSTSVDQLKSLTMGDWEKWGQMSSSRPAFANTLNRTDLTTRTHRRNIKENSLLVEEFRGAHSDLYTSVRCHLIHPALHEGLSRGLDECVVDFIAADDSAVLADLVEIFRCYSTRNPRTSRETTSNNRTWHDIS